MRILNVFIEIDGVQRLAGMITGNNSQDASFSYADEYLDSEYAQAISISLPLDGSPFSARSTKCFFEGLLPEGYSRRSVAKWLRSDEDDYISLLAGLGIECLGAIKIVEEGRQSESADYVALPNSEVRRIAAEGAVKTAQIMTNIHLSLAGASGKVGLMYNQEDGSWFLPLGDAPSTHILKQSHVRLDHIVANEQLCMTTASILGLNVSESFIVNTGEYRDEDVLFATKRYDRDVNHSVNTINSIRVPLRLHQEDFAQALGIPAAEKYENGKQGYLAKMFSLLRRYSADPMADIRKLWEIIIFNYLIGNTDGHIKNISLLYSPNLKKIRLAPAYDIVSTAVYESSTREMAFYIGKHCFLDEIEKSDFELAAREAGLGKQAAFKSIDALTASFRSALDRATEILNSEGFTMADEIHDRILSNAGISFFLSK